MTVTRLMILVFFITIMGGALFAAYHLVMSGHPWFALLFLLVGINLRVTLK